jgi:hypothetical protein
MAGVFRSLEGTARTIMPVGVIYPLSIGVSDFAFPRIFGVYIASLDLFLIPDRLGCPALIGVALIGAALIDCMIFIFVVHS